MNFKFIALAFSICFRSIFKIIQYNLSYNCYIVLTIKMTGDMHQSFFIVYI